jgi:hypothetical protein
MARINPETIRTVKQNSNDQFDSGMYRQYSMERDLIRGGSNTRDSRKKELKVRSEEGLFYKLRRLMYGPDILPDLDKYVAGRISQRQQNKIPRYEDYYRRVQSNVK